MPQPLPRGWTLTEFIDAKAVSLALLATCVSVILVYADNVPRFYRIVPVNELAFGGSWRAGHSAVLSGEAVYGHGMLC